MAATHKEKPALEVTCPCCKTRLHVDADNGHVLRQDRPTRRSRKSFEAALKEERSRAATTDSQFDKALDAQRHAQTSLDRKFQEAMKKASQEPDEKPPHPLDWD